MPVGDTREPVGHHTLPPRPHTPSTQGHLGTDAKRLLGGRASGPGLEDEWIVQTEKQRPVWTPTPHETGGQAWLGACVRSGPRTHGDGDSTQKSPGSTVRLLSHTARGLDSTPKRRFKGKSRGTKHPKAKIKQLKAHLRQWRQLCLIQSTGPCPPSAPAKDSTETDERKHQ